MCEIEKLVEKLCATDELFTKEEEESIRNLIELYSIKKDTMHKLLYSIGSLLDYNDLKRNGKTKEQISSYMREDYITINEAEQYVNKYLELKDNMFGYPANMHNNTFVVEYLRYLESKLYLINSCGGPNERGNYQMDNKDMELKIIELFMKNLNINKENYWGYITSGGTEGNYWGIKSGFDKFPNGILYFSSDAHYSVNKCVNSTYNMVYLNEKISSDYGKIDTNDLLERCRKNWENNNRPAILLLTWGTTKTGAIDDVSFIEEELTKLNIPHYIHLDAALFGGIPNNQINSPALLNFSSLNVDSVSISLHKYLGSTKVNGIVISKNKSKGNYVDYIGQEDSTVLGSRDFLPFQIYQRTLDLYERANPNEYNENINYFIEEATKNNLSFSRNDKSNIFIIKKPSDELCIKYQLATFSDGINQYAHIILFPSHKKENILLLITDIVKENNLEKSLYKC